MLTVAEVALALVLVAGAGLMARTFTGLLAVDTGLTTSELLAAEISLPLSRYRTAADQTRFFQDVEARVRALPGVHAAGLVNTLPLTGSWSLSPVTGESGGEPADALVYFASAGYFEATGLPLIGGRLFDARDDGRAPQVALVSARLADRLWPGRDAVGRRVVVGPNADPWTVVGVVGDVHHRRLDRAPDAGVYLPYTQTGLFRGVVVASTGGDPLALAPAVRRVVRDLDPAQPLFNVRSLEALVDEAVSPARLLLGLVGAFSLIALVLKDEG